MLKSQMLKCALNYQPPFTFRTPYLAILWPNSTNLIVQANWTHFYFPNMPCSLSFSFLHILHLKNVASLFFLVIFKLIQEVTPPFRSLLCFCIRYHPTLPLYTVIAYPQGSYAQGSLIHHCIPSTQPRIL